MATRKIRRLKQLGPFSWPSFVGPAAKKQ